MVHIYICTMIVVDFVLLTVSQSLLNVFFISGPATVTSCISICAPVSVNNEDDLFLLHFTLIIYVNFMNDI